MVLAGQLGTFKGPSIRMCQESCPGGPVEQFHSWILSCKSSRPRDTKDRSCATPSAIPGKMCASQCALSCER